VWLARLGSIEDAQRPNAPTKGDQLPEPCRWASWRRHSIRDEKTMVVPEHDDRTDSTNSEMPLLRLQVPARAITPASPRSSPSAHAREPRNHSGTELADARDREHSAGERKTDTATCGRVRRVS